MSCASPQPRFATAGDVAYLRRRGTALAAESGRLLGKTKRNDTVEALVAIAAIRLNQPIVILQATPTT